MSEFRRYWLAIGISLMLLVSACGPSAGQDSAISTAVAQTVQAGQSLTETAVVPTDTREPNPTMQVTNELTLAPVASLPATASGGLSTESAAGLCTASASLVGETIPDGTIVQPGTTFTKVWQINNSGTCTWDSSWQLIFFGGDQLGGLTVYSFPQPAQPGQTVDIPVILKAPDQNGTYTGEWMLKSPWGQSFGVGQYSVPISVSIVVGSGTPANNKTETVFGVTAVTYQVDRRCTTANTFYTITANITTNGPAEITFTWVQSDGNNQRNNRLNFVEATTKSAQREWVQHVDSSPNPRWVQVIITSPTYREFESVVLPKLCGQE